MKANRSEKTIHYKHARFLNGTSKTLQAHIDNARKAKKNASERAQKLDNDTDQVRIWNGYTKNGLLTCGMFHSYEIGKSQLILAVKDDVEEYPITAATPPPTKDSKHTEFNEGLLFFGIHNNHVLLVQSAALRISVFEDYLNWLLREATSEIEENNRIELSDPIPRKILQNRDIDPLKSIIFSPQLHSQTTPDTSHPTVSRKLMGELKRTLSKSEWHPLRDLLRTMGADVPNELRLDEGFKPERVQVNIELKWLGRKKDREKTPLLDDVLQGFLQC